jgi:hypothetical protein
LGGEQGAGIVGWEGEREDWEDIGRGFTRIDTDKKKRMYGFVNQWEYVKISGKRVWGLTLI